jgi:hypothetical protein
MQQHFNENYLESNKYPRAIFKGQIEQFKPNSVKPSLLLLYNKWQLNNTENAHFTGQLCH